MVSSSRVLSNRPGLHRRRGLTLMELVIVLAILAAVAALLVPLFPNLARRAHKATDATQTAEVAKAIQLHQGAYVSYPEGFDLLTDPTGVFPTYLPAETPGSPFGGFVKADALTPEEAAALGRVGISMGHQLATTPIHPTLNPYAAPLNTPTALNSAGLRVAIIDPNDPAIATALATNNLLANVIQQNTVGGIAPRFILFGVGPRTTMVGTTIQDAPTSVPQKKNFTPDNTYSRIGVIFMISGREVSKSERARFVAAVAMEDDELESTEKDIIGYYEVSSQP